MLAFACIGRVGGVYGDHMKRLSLAEIADRMKGIDIAILSTHTDGGEIANRPMSNNSDVAYNGDSYFFTHEKARCVSDIQHDPKVALSYSGKAGIFSGAGIYVAVEGKAELIRDPAAFQRHWTADLDRWFERGVDTPGLILIKVKARRITYWDGGEEGEIVL
jgi:general stress protein 26